MSETSASLLESACSADDPTAWQTLSDIYTSLIRRWLLREGVPENFINGAVESVLGTLAENLPRFREDRSRGFRERVRKITADYLRRYWRVSSLAPMSPGAINYQKTLDDLDSADSSLSRMWDKEHDEYVSNCLLKRIKPEFTSDVWTAFLRLSRDDGDPTAIAADLEMSLNAAFAARSKVLDRLRNLGDGLIA